jgi:hypothetical protein
MTDIGSFSVQSEVLRSHAGHWTTKAADADAALTTITPAVGMGDDFGYLAGLNGVSDNYDSWTHDMSAALGDARDTFRYLHAALVSTANAYDGVDATAATAMAELDPMNNVR